MANIVKTQIDFSLTPLSPNYSPFYAVVLDNAFSPEECARLVAHASESTPWIPAGLSAHGPTQTVHTNFRNSDRILHIDEEMSNLIYNRLRPHVKELWEIAPRGRWGVITGKEGRKQGPTWKLVGVNPRLSFLRYGPGHYFKPHCDGLIDLHEGRQKSFVTLHIYLNDAKHPDLLPATTAPIPLEGGATRFHTPSREPSSAVLDVVPEVGRVLIFQQRMLVHSGEEVVQGTKYTLRSDFMFEMVV